MTFTKNEFETSIFMRLGINSSAKISGHQTLKVYEDFLKQNECVWFSTDSLTRGISAKQRSKYLDAINDGLTVYVYFVVGKIGDGKNEIEYRAEIIDMKSDGEGMSTPEENLTPDEWKKVNYKIWIKMENLQICTNLTTTDFVVVSSGNVLAKSIAHSQYHFGYIKLKKV